MSRTDLSARIQQLSPEQQELLRRRMQAQRASQQAPEPVAADSGATAAPVGTTPRKIDLGLFFFSADGTQEGGQRYELLLEATRFADRHGFTAVWTPERHFQAFGGLYPNPSVLAAALAMITEQVSIRAGSLVLPLHSVVRVAEDWAVVDNLSHGRVGISFATGWHTHDYVIAPEAYEDRRQRMFRDIPLVRRLWAGEEVEIPGVGGAPTRVRTLPRPLQKELPIWVTASSPRTWQQAGEIGANVLSALIGGTLEQLGAQIARYRQARLENGHDPRTGIVSLMLHTYLGDDLEITKERVRAPMKRYLQQFVNQFRPLTEGGLAAASSAEMQDLLDFAFERYFDHSSLLGTAEKCAAMLDQLAAIGVDEAACLVDFGLDLASTLESLERLDALRRSRQREAVAVGT